MAIESDVQNADARLSVKFYCRAVKNEFKSEQEGRAIFEDRDFVQIFIPGDSTTIVDTFVREDHKLRFPRHWAHYQNTSGDSAKQIGTPITQWAMITPAQAEELKALKFYTVENVAGASDAQLQRIGMVAGMSPHAFRDRAKNFLKVAADEATANKNDEENKQLREQLQALQEKVRAMEEPEKRKPGRPPLNRTEETQEAA